MNSKAWVSWLSSACLGLAILMTIVGIWRLSEKNAKLRSKVASLEAEIANLADAGVDASAHDEEVCKRCSGMAEERGRVEGRERAQQDRRETEAMARPRCNPMLPPFLPCCGEEGQTSGVPDPDRWPAPEDFRNGRTLALSCARLAPGAPTGASWLCARTEARCEASKRRREHGDGACTTCVVHLASGLLRGEDFVWTGHAIDEMDGPWTADGKRGAAP